MTNQEVYNIVKENKDSLDEFIKEQKKVNEMVVRHDEKIRGIWKIPVITGGILTIMGAIITLISLLH